MKQKTKILLIVLGAIAFIFLLVLYTASLFQPQIAHSFISSSLPNKPEIVQAVNGWAKISP